MESRGQSENTEDECVAISKGEDDSSSLRWFNFNINGVVLYRFMIIF